MNIDQNKQKYNSNFLLPTIQRILYTDLLFFIITFTYNWLTFKGLCGTETSGGFFPLSSPHKCSIFTYWMSDGFLTPSLPFVIVCIITVLLIVLYLVRIVYLITRRHD